MSVKNNVRKLTTYFVEGEKKVGAAKLMTDHLVFDCRPSICSISRHSMIMHAYDVFDISSQYDYDVFDISSQYDYDVFIKHSFPTNTVPSQSKIFPEH